MSIIEIKPPTEREPGPYPAKRPCSQCGAYLNRYNPGPMCGPCSGPPVEVDPSLIDHIAEMPDLRSRRRAFEALAEYGEAA